MSEPPQQLRDRANWLLWKYEPTEKGKPAKVPYRLNGHKGSTTDPKSRWPYDEVVAVYADDPGAFNGLGFVFSGEGIVGVDLDGVVQRDGTLLPWAAKILAENPTYWELSPSGTGLHGFFLGSVSKALTKAPQEEGGSIEVYDNGRFFTWTGKAYGEPAPLAPLPECLSSIAKTSDEKTAITDDDVKRCREKIMSMPWSKMEEKGSWKMIAVACEIARYGLIDRRGKKIFVEYATKHADPPWEKNGKQGYDRKWDEGMKEAVAKGEVGAYLPAPGLDAFDVIKDDEPPNALKEEGPYVSFPIDALLPEHAAYIRAVAESLTADVSCTAPAFLTSIGALIGNRRWADATGNWPVSPNLWTALVMNPGTGKSSAIKNGLRFIEFVEEKFNDQFKADYAEWKRLKDEENVETDPPVRGRFMIGDTTMEAMIRIHHSSPNGLLEYADELTGWFQGIAQYKGGKGTDRGHWLSMWTGENISFDRVGSNPPFIYLPRPLISLAGGIQPDKFRDSIYKEGREDGMCQRLLIAMPPNPQIGRLRRGGIDPRILEPAAAVFTALDTLSQRMDDSLSKMSPVVMSFTEAAFEVADDFIFKNKLECQGLEDAYLSGHWSKLNIYLIRFSTILELCKWAVGRGSDDVVGVESVQDAIRIVEWFKKESRRAYTFLGESTADQNERVLIEWIKTRGGRCNENILTQQNPAYRGAGGYERARRDITALVKNRRGTREVTKTATNDKTEFVLY